MNKKVSVNVAFAIILLAMTVTFSVTMIVSMTIFDNTVSSVTRKQAQFSKLAELDTYVRGNLFGEIDELVLNDKIAQGYINGIGDKYAVYYSEKEFTEMQAFAEGTIVGIGLEVVKDADGYFRIVRVYPDSPAAKAELQIGGRITFVDEVDTKTLTSVKALQSLLRGEQGTVVELKCLYGAAEETQYTVQRVNYTAPTVEYQKVGDFAYIRISSFGPNTYADFDYLVKEAISDGVVGFTFDLRGNAGENEKVAFDIIDLICPLGTVAKVENKSGVIRNIATSDEESLDMPMSVIVNENTAAAAEIFALSVRDLSGGKIVGAKTMGRGMLQSAPQKLSDGSAVSITTGRLLTGKDESFEGVGITPDVEVLLQNDDASAIFNPVPENDQQILRGLEVVRNTIISEGGEAPALITATDKSKDTQPASGATGEEDLSSGSTGETASTAPEEESSSSQSSSSSGR